MARWEGGASQLGWAREWETQGSQPSQPSHPMHEVPPKHPLTWASPSPHRLRGLYHPFGPVHLSN